MNLKFFINWRFLVLLAGSFLFYLLTEDGSEALLLLILISYLEVSKVVTNK